MSKKYEIVEDDFIIHKGKKLYRIKALETFCAGGRYTVYKGDLGGYVEGYRNLSQKGSCWIFDDAKVCGNARVEDRALVSLDAKVYGNAVIKDDAVVSEDAVIYGNAVIKDDAFVCRNAKIYENAEVRGHAAIKEESQVYGNALIFGNFLISNSQYCDNAGVKGSYNVLN